MQPRLSREQAQTLWTNTVRKMVRSYGAPIPNQLTEQAIIDYLISQSEKLAPRPDAVAEADADISYTQMNSVLP